MVYAAHALTRDSPSMHARRPKTAPPVVVARLGSPRGVTTPVFGVASNSNGKKALYHGSSSVEWVKRTIGSTEVTDE